MAMQTQPEVISPEATNREWALRDAQRAADPGVQKRARAEATRHALGLELQTFEVRLATYRNRLRIAAGRYAQAEAEAKIAAAEASVNEARTLNGVVGIRAELDKIEDEMPSEIAELNSLAAAAQQREGEENRRRQENAFREEAFNLGVANTIKAIEAHGRLSIRDGKIGISGGFDGRTKVYLAVFKAEIRRILIERERWYPLE